MRGRNSKKPISFYPPIFCWHFKNRGLWLRRFDVTQSPLLEKIFEWPPRAGRDSGIGLAEPQDELRVAFDAVEETELEA